MKILDGIKIAGNFVYSKAEKHSPEICLGLGICGMVAATVFACKGTIKAKKVIEKGKDTLDLIDAAEKTGTVYDENNLPVPYTEDDARKERIIVVGRTAFGVVKAYGPAGILTATGIALILHGHNILKKRNLALIAAYKSVSKAYEKYQDKVEKILGKDAAKKLKYSLEEKEVEEETGKKNKDGTPKTKKVKYTVLDPKGTQEFFSPYARFFDSSNINWVNDPERNKLFLVQMMHWCNDKLKLKGILTLNDIYEELGFQPTKSGQVVGWEYKNHIGEIEPISFGIYDDVFIPNRDFVNGLQPIVLLDFNVDGPVWDDLPEDSEVTNVGV